MTNVDLDLYDFLGQKIVTLVNKSMPAGEHEIQWDGCSDIGPTATTGIYCNRLEVSDQVETKKVLLQK